MASKNAAITFIALVALVVFDPGGILSGQAASKNGDFRVSRTPGEFEPQAAVWMIWPPTENYLSGFSNSKLILKLVEMLAPVTRIKLAVADDSLYELAAAQVPRSTLISKRVEIVRIPSIDLWTRDMGPAFVIGSEGSPGVVDFDFNTWGYSDGSDPENAIEEQFDERVAASMGLPCISSEMVSEPGDHELNGKGTMMVVESVELGRNPAMTKEQIQQEFKRVYGVTKVIWLKKGLKEDEHAFLGPIKTKDGGLAYTSLTTNGHVDEFARFSDSSTILLAEVDPEDLNDPIAKENHLRLEENYRRLLNETDQDGKPFRIIRMPMPETITRTVSPGEYMYEMLASLEYLNGHRFPAGEPIQLIAAASYLNFLISNGIVIAPRYGLEGLPESGKKRDQVALRVLQKAFPDREVRQVDALAVNFGGGGIHCITKQQPLLSLKE